MHRLLKSSAVHGNWLMDEISNNPKTNKVSKVPDPINQVHAKFKGMNRKMNYKIQQNATTQNHPRVYIYITL